MEHIEIGGQDIGFRDFEDSVQAYTPPATTGSRTANDYGSALQAQNLVSAMAAFGAGQDLDKLSTPDMQQPLLMATGSEKQF